MKSMLHIVQEARSAPRLNLHPASAPVAAKAFSGRAAVVTLGCAKNHVDSEVMLGVLAKEGFEIVSELDRADIAIVNTCGFLESAARESVDAILELAKLKKTGQLRQLIVAGCLVERYKDDLKASLPEVDEFILGDDLMKVGSVARGEFRASLQRAERPYFLYDDAAPRILASQPHFAYVKVAEGCDRPCTFCIIPKIRGAARSREVQSVVREVQALGAVGVREVNLVAQDLTSYGKDRGSERLIDLLQALNAADSVDWVRLLYAYPIGVDAELLRAIVDLPIVCNYLDMPLQHVSVPLLQTMKRPVGRYAARDIIEFIRKTAPEIELRTTFIVGFPGETEEHARELEAFVAEGHFRSVGVFTYSPESGTPAAEMDGQVAPEQAEERRARVMEAQQRVLSRTQEGLIGQRFECLVEGPHPESELLVTGRTRFQAPEVDGTVIINDLASPDPEAELSRLAPGTLGAVEITEVAGYDLVGTFHPAEENAMTAGAAA